MKCRYVVYSRARHDFHWCKCESVAIDGGFDYKKICGDFQNWKHVSLELDATKNMLYNDWNSGEDDYGKFHVDNPTPEIISFEVQ